MSPSATHSQIETLATTPGIFQSMLATALPEQLNWKPAPDRWSASEVFTHLIHVEENNVRLRIRRIVEEDNPVLVDYDQMKEFAQGTYSGKDGRAQLERFVQVRAESVAWLRTVPDAAFDRTAQHPECGVIRARQILNLWAFHDLGHIRQVAELWRATAFWQGIGSLQRYYSVRP